MSQIANTPNTAAAADDPQTPALVTPDQFTNDLRALMAQVPDVPSLTRQERRILQTHRRVSESEVRAAINVVRASDKLAGVVDEKTDEMEKVLSDSSYWTAAESELKAALKRVADANLVRQQRMSVFAISAYGVGTQLAKSPENSDLVPHVQVLKASRRRKKATPAAPAPDPAPALAPVPAPELTPASAPLALVISTAKQS